MKKTVETIFTEEHRELVMDALNTTKLLDSSPRFRKRINTNIKCPVCSQDLILSICGDSFEVICHIDGLLITMRGY
jgi:hypothetical protein